MIGDIHVDFDEAVSNRQYHQVFKKLKKAIEYIKMLKELGNKGYVVLYFYIE